MSSSTACCAADARAARLQSNDVAIRFTESADLPIRYHEVVLADPVDPEHEERKEWVGPYFDPERFDLEQVNSALRRIR